MAADGDDAGVDLHKNIKLFSNTRFDYGGPRYVTICENDKLRETIVKKIDKAKDPASWAIL